MSVPEAHFRLPAPLPVIIAQQERIQAAQRDLVLHVVQDNIQALALHRVKRVKQESIRQEELGLVVFV